MVTEQPPRAPLWTPSRDRALSSNMAEVRFFPGATLNVAENLLARLPIGHPAVVAYTEAGRRSSFSGDELRNAVAAFAATLRASGIEPGDRVVVMLPNGVEAIVAM